MSAGRRNTALKVLIRLALLAGLVCCLPQSARAEGESILFFKNGRALRVVNYRTEGDWLFFMVSKPSPQRVKQAAADDEEDAPSEMGVRRDSIKRIQSITDRPSRSLRGRVAHGGRGTTASKKDLPHVPAAGSAAAKVYGGGAFMPNIDVEHNTAGQMYTAPLNRLRPPHYIIEAARKFRLEREREKARRRAAAAAAAKAASGTTDPPATPPQAAPSSPPTPSPPSQAPPPASGTSPEKSSSGDGSHP
ncbi:MAG: hypothetical protein ACE5ID_06015 [Acidobacteriota bacterium]